MATGVEMLGQMSEDINLAGPVQGGNMVVKPNEAPVGAAAMLSKQLRNQANRGVAGIYELPTPQEQLPAFMKIAQEGVERQAADRRNIYPGNFADDEGGIVPMLPRNLRTRPGAPETTLAYITPEEQAILGLLTPGTPHEGPEGIPSYDSFDYDPDTGKSSFTSGAESSAREARDRGDTSQDRRNISYGDRAGVTIDTSTKEGQDKRQEFRDRTGSNVVTDAEIAGRKALGREAADTSAPAGGFPSSTSKQDEEEKKLINDIEKAVEEGDADAIDKLINDVKTLGTDVKNIINNLTDKAGSVISGIFDFDKSDKKKGKKKSRKSFIDSLLSGGAFGTVMDMISKPTEDSFKDNNFLAIMQNKYLDEEGNIRPGMEDDFERYSKEYSDLIPKAGAGKDISMKEILMSGKIEEGSDLEKRLRPNKYWSENKPRTAQDFRDMAEAQRFGKLKFTKANTQAIEEGRRLLENERRDSRGGNISRGGFSRPASMEEEETTTIVEADDMTMPYKGPRTGDVEKDVPLGRRFKTDPTQDVAQYTTTPRTQEEIYKYMTEGTTGEGIGLEPFSEYQRRRRKAMGLEPLGLYG